MGQTDVTGIEIDSMLKELKTKKQQRDSEDSSEKTLVDGSLRLDGAETTLPGGRGRDLWSICRKKSAPVAALRRASTDTVPGDIKVPPTLPAQWGGHTGWCKSVFSCWMVMAMVP